MVFTAAQTLAFFTQAAQMAIPVATNNAMADESIVQVQDFADLDEEAMKLVVAYLRKPGDHIPHPQAGLRLSSVLKLRGRPWKSAKTMRLKYQRFPGLFPS